MKIVNVYNGDFISSSQGGGMRYIRDLMAEQHRRGYEVELLAVGRGDPLKIEINGTPVTYVPISTTLKWPAFLLGMALYLIRHRACYHGAIFHLHRVYFSPAVRLFIRHGFVVVTIHTKTFAVLMERFPVLQFLLPGLLVLERFILKTCVDRLSAAGDYAIGLYGARHGIPHHDIVFLSGPSLIQRPDRPDPELYDASWTTILCVGRIAAVKRPLSVLRLFDAVLTARPDWLSSHRLVFVGDGEGRGELVGAVSSLQRDGNVKIFGSVDADRMPAIYAAADALILLSSSEVGPFTVKEALAIGLRVFATRVGNVEDCVPHECGVTVPVDRPEERVEEFIAFLEKDFKPSSCRATAEAIYRKELALFTKGLDALYRGYGPS